MDHKNIYQLLDAFGVQDLITEEDDPDLWEAVFKKYWAKLRREAIANMALFFDIATIDRSHNHYVAPTQQWSLISNDNGRFQVVRPSSQAEEGRIIGTIGLAARGLQTP